MVSRRDWLTSLGGIVPAWLGIASRAKGAEVGSAEYTKKLIQFNNAYYVFVHDYFGCDPAAMHLSECTLGSGHTNYAAYLAASRLVKEVFPQ